MTELQAREHAEQARTEHQVPDRFQLAHAERRFIELIAAPGTPPPVRDCLVWVVRFAQGARWVELAIDDASAAVVRVEKSRAAVRAATPRAGRGP